MRLPASERSLHGCACHYGRPHKCAKVKRKTYIHGCACRYGRPHKGETPHQGAMSHGGSRPKLL